MQKNTTQECKRSLTLSPVGTNKLEACLFHLYPRLIVRESNDGCVAESIQWMNGIIILNKSAPA